MSLMQEIGIEPATRTRFIEAMARLPSAVSVVTTDGPHGRDGVTVSAVTSVSAETVPPTVVICIHERSRALPRVLGNGSFCINVLAEDQAGLAERFAGREPLEHRLWFADERWFPMPSTAPALTTAAVCIDCVVRDANLVGQHHVLMASVQAVVLPRPRPPLVRALRAYHGLASVSDPSKKGAPSAYETTSS